MLNYIENIISHCTKKVNPLSQEKGAYLDVATKERYTQCLMRIFYTSLRGMSSILLHMGVKCVCMNKFAIRLKEIRIEKSYSQSKLAQLLNVDQRTISNWENAVREPDFDMLIKITLLFDVSTDYLLGLTD